MKVNWVWLVVAVVAVLLLSSGAFKKDDSTYPIVKTTVRPNGGGGGGGGGDSPTDSPSAGPVPASFHVENSAGQNVVGIDWGPLYPGENVSVPLRFVPDGDSVYSSFSVYATDFSPSWAANYLTASYGEGKLWLSVNSYCKQSGNFTFNIVIMGVAA